MEENASVFCRCGNWNPCQSRCDALPPAAAGRAVCATEERRSRIAGRPRAVELVVRAGNAAVVELSPSIRAAVAETLELRERREHVKRPGLESAEGGPHVARQDFSVGDVARPLTI